MGRKIELKEMQSKIHSIYLLNFHFAKYLPNFAPFILSGSPDFFSSLVTPYPAPTSARSFSPYVTCSAQASAFQTKREPIFSPAPSHHPYTYGLGLQCNINAIKPANGASKKCCRVQMVEIKKEWEMMPFVKVGFGFC